MCAWSMLNGLFKNQEQRLGESRAIFNTCRYAIELMVTAMYSGLAWLYLEVQKHPYLQPEKQNACWIQRACRYWDFSLRFKVNTQSCDRKNRCIMISCTASWPALLVDSKKSAVMLFWDCALRNRELLLLFPAGGGGVHV